MLNPFIIEKALKEAYIEDNHYMDLSSDLLIAEDTQAKGTMTAKARGVICGVALVNQAFLLQDSKADILWHVKEGDVVERGQILMAVSGNARALLKAERIALNFLQRMSGIATMTREYVMALNNEKIKLVDTRKTTPLFRPFEKYSVFVGGGANHRYNLSDAIMIKDNHIEVCGGITAAVSKARALIGHTVKIEVEVESLEQLQEAMAAGCDIVMLDNMDDEAIGRAVALRNDFVSHPGQVLLEVSGNVTLPRLGALGKMGIDVVSSGALTHSYGALDISFNVAILGTN